jgi:hypothetical protein
LDDRQFGVGLGGVLAFVGFLVMLTDGLALRGMFKGDRFVSGAVGVLAACILIVTAWPVFTMLGQMFTPLGELGSAAALIDRIADNKIWGLGCVVGRVNCGVFWNTLLLATSTASAATRRGNHAARQASTGERICKLFAPCRQQLCKCEYLQIPKSQVVPLRPTFFTGDELRRSLARTDIIETIMGLVRRVCRNVKRWRDASMALRWTAAAMLEAAKGLRKLKATS